MGDLTPRMFVGRDGTRQLSLDVQADSVEFLTSPASAGEGMPAAQQSAPRPAAPAYSAPAAPAGLQAIDEDELPF